eukprot:scaffold2738_cov119-Cylindrotheca_fusiformis.AAC.5
MLQDIKGGFAKMMPKSWVMEEQTDCSPPLVVVLPLSYNDSAEMNLEHLVFHLVSTTDVYRTVHITVQ